MRTCTSSYRFLTLVTLLALLLPLSPSPPLLAQREPSTSPVTVRSNWMDTTADTSAPAAVTNLVAGTGTVAGTVELSWTAPGDDATTGTASAYTVRYNTTTITESNWATSTDATGEPTPNPAGSVESMTVSGLTPGQRYYFAIKTQDEVPNTSGVSNSPRAAANSPNTVYLPLVVSSASSVPAVIPDTTEVLPETTTQYLSEISSDGAVFTFTQSTPALNGLAPGDVMVGDATTNAPYGFLRQVTSVSSVGGQVVVETGAATLEDAIESGAAHVSHVLTPDDIQGGMQAKGVTLAAPQLQDEFYFTLEDVVLYDDDGDLETTGDQIKADGSIRLEPGFDFSLVVRDWKLEELSFTTSAKETAELEIKAEIELLSVEEEKEIARHYFNPITVMVGWVPVVIVPVLTVNVGVDGSVHVGVTTGVTQETTLIAGLRYAGETWSPVSHFSNQFHYNPPTLSAGLDLKGYAGAQLSLLLYGVTGPYAESNAYLKLEADLADDPWWTLYGGLEASGGVKIEVLGHSIADYESPAIIGYRLTLAQAQSNTPPNLPFSPFPADDAVDQSVNVDLSWSGGDLDGDAVTYDVYFEAGDATPDVLVSNDQASIAYDPGTLSPNTHYYWRIVAQDEHGATTAGPVWDFVTGLSSNDPPNTPSSPSPADNATNQSVSVDLSWTGGDPDGDSVTYDVHFEAGDSTPDVLVSDDQSGTTHDPGMLNPNTQYYWRIVAKDEHGATTHGPVWEFTTGTVPPCPITLTLEPPTGGATILPSAQWVYTHTLTNLGNEPATLDIVRSNPPSGWTYTLQPSSVGLAPSQSAVVTLTVMAGTIGQDLQDVAVIAAIWQGVMAVCATAVDTTTVGCVSLSGANIEYSPTAPVIGQTVTFTATVTGGIPPFNYTWDFGDSSGDTGRVVTHAYDDDRSYNVQLTVTNCGGVFLVQTQRTVIVNPVYDNYP